jgi:type IV pilus assembly protein PilY1
MNGTANRCEELVGGGLPPSPVAGMVTLDGIDSNGDGDTSDAGDTPGATVPFLIGGSPESSLQGKPPTTPITASQPKSRVYWNIQQ